MFANTLIVIALSLVVGTAASGQGSSVPFGTTPVDSSQPVEVSAEQLSVDQTSGMAVFTGSVVVIQGSLRMSADRMVVHYAEAEGDGQGRISQLDAEGSVTVTNGEEAAEADTATYDVADGIVVMGGDVLLTQGQNALSSETLRIDLSTGRGNFEGRVRTVYDPNANR
jgi:lipopolysaccharide export system protein LptA